MNLPILRRLDLGCIGNPVISLIPDFISNCGMARVFAYFMERKVQMTDEAIFNDTSITIRNAIQNTFNNNSSKTQISSTAFEIALKQLT